MLLQVRIGDVTSHGGVIVSGSPNTPVNAIPEARLTDIHICPIHGGNIIVSGSFNTNTNILPNARIGDVCACGACIVTGSPNTTTN
jgi:uncharacterized Zn-binding protein involved in type VI secretion